MRNGEKNVPVIPARRRFGLRRMNGVKESLRWGKQTSLESRSCRGRLDRSLVSREEAIRMTQGKSAGDSCISLLEEWRD